MADQRLGLFAPPTGRRIQRFGAALSGTLPQLDVAFAREEEQRRKQQQELSEERRRAFLLDNRAALRLLQGDRPDDAKRLLQNRIGEVNRLGGDPSQTMEILSMLERGETEDVLAGLQMIDNRAVDEGIFEPLPVEEAPKPTTEAGKARADFRAGFITQDELNTILTTPPKFQTDVGKLIGDKQTAIDLFGADSPQVRLIDEAIRSDQAGEEPGLSDVSGLRKEFTKLSGDFITLRDAIGKVKQAEQTPSAAGDLSLIFNFMKINDPGSTVREGEFATAQNAAGIPERIRAQYNRIMRGERLTEIQRKDFVDTADRMFSSQMENQIRLEDSIGGIAERQGMNREDVIIDFIGESRPVIDDTLPAFQEGATATNQQTGEQIIFRGGRWQKL